MSVKRTANFIAICLVCLTLEAKAQKNGFRGGSKSYEVHVEASSVGTNLHYELPESKVKAASKQDWLVDNDNAEMLAINSPVAATVNVKHPKFSMKGQWPGYKTSFKIPKDVSVASKRTDFSKSNPERHHKMGTKVEQHMYKADRISGSAQDSSEQAKVDHKTASSGFLLSRIAEKLFNISGKKLGHENRREMLNISRLLLPIAEMKNFDLKNPHVSKAMKGVIKHARKMVDEAKTVLSDAANFITRVRKLVKVTKDQTQLNGQVAKANVVVKETGKTGSKGFAAQASKLPATLTQERGKAKNGRHIVTESVQNHDLKGRQSLQSDLADQNRKTGQGNQEREIKRKHDSASSKSVSKRSYLYSRETENLKAHENDKNERVKRRGLPDTLESILFTINGLKNIFKYH